MKYLAIDIETTSIKPEDGQILSFAAVIEDTSFLKPIKDLPSFYCVFKLDKIKGEPYALNMNRVLIEQISAGKSKSLIDQKKFCVQFKEFLVLNGFDDTTKLRVAGKNVASFDIPWIESHIPDFEHYFKFSHRTLDVGSVMVDFKTDEWIPNLLECKKRARVKGEVVHNALDDCYDVIEVLRSKY